MVRPTKRQRRKQGKQRLCPGEKGRGEEEKQEEVAPIAVMPKQRQRVIMSKNDGPYLQSWQQRHANEKQFETRKSLPPS